MSDAVSTRPVTLIRPRTGWLDLGLGEVWQQRELLYFLVWRDLKVRYSQAALGAAWAIIQPLLAVVIFTVIFGVFAKLPSDGLPYPVFAFAAILPWTYFSEAVRRSSLGLVGDAELVKKVYFPRLIIPMANIFSPLMDFAVSLGVLVLLMLWYGLMPTANLLAVPVLLAITALLALAIGLWLGPINVRYRDVVHTLPFVLQIWMYATPIVYPLSMVPERFKTLYSMNPAVGLIEGFRWAVLGRGTLDTMALAISTGVTVVMLIGGLLWFKREERQFADVI
jgi:lipopolysaccharide transport system permease protein